MCIFFKKKVQYVRHVLECVTFFIILSSHIKKPFLFKNRQKFLPPVLTKTLIFKVRSKPNCKESCSIIFCTSWNTYLDCISSKMIKEICIRSTFRRFPCISSYSASDSEPPLDGRVEADLRHLGLPVLVVVPLPIDGKRKKTTITVPNNNMLFSSRVPLWVCSAIKL